VKARIGNRAVVIDPNRVRGGVVPRKGVGQQVMHGEAASLQRRRDNRETKSLTRGRSVRVGLEATQLAGSNPAPSPTSFTLLGQMQSGKNRVLITRTGHRYPPKRFAVWRDEKVNDCLRHLKGDYSPFYSYREPILLTVQYWPGDLKRRDVPGMLDAMCHILERAQVVSDDAQIKAVDWQEMDLDRKNPRVLITLTPSTAGRR